MVRPDRSILALRADTHAPDDVYDTVRAQFGEAGLLNLTKLTGLINLWDRLSFGFRTRHSMTVEAA